MAILAGLPYAQASYTITQLTDNDYGDYYPQINSLGHIAWIATVGGEDIEIFFYDGTSITQLTDNTYTDAYIYINANDMVA